jgi:squalene-hopene/tetraprenyl-beta-curcumene cyclase
MNRHTPSLAVALSVTLVGIAVAQGPAPAAAGAKPVTLPSSEQPAGTLGVSLRNEVNAAMDRALDWLAAQQSPNGSWSNTNFPALTGLALQAVAATKHPRRAEIMKRGAAFIAGCARSDGGIYRDVAGKGGGLSNYNTAICMTALHATGDRSHAALVLNARKFLAGAQHLGDDEYKGGFGYDAGTNRKYTDLLNTFYAVRAMRETQSLEDLRKAGEKPADIDWAATVRYVERLQNQSKDGAEQAGGFFYKPGESKAGATTNADGRVVFRSFGSMTYVGLLALLYAEVGRDDVRVRSAFDWACRHWTLEENPGMGPEGIYFFYNVLAKSLDVYGQELVPRPNGSFLNWREELAKKLVALQKTDSKTGHGYWINANNRFWEGDPVLVTAYTLLALAHL